MPFRREKVPDRGYVLGRAWMPLEEGAAQGKDWRHSGARNTGPNNDGRDNHPALSQPPMMLVVAGRWRRGDGSAGEGEKKRGREGRGEKVEEKRWRRWRRTYGSGEIGGVGDRRALRGKR